MFLVQGFLDRPGELEPTKVYEIKNHDRDEALKNFKYIAGLKIFDQVTLAPDEGKIIK